MRILCIACAVLLLVGCGSTLQSTKDLTSGIMEYFTGQDNAEPPNELVELEPSIKLNLLWKETIGDGYGEANVNLVPVIVDEQVYVANHSGRLEALDRMTGKSLWAVDTELPLSSGPSVGQQLLYLGSSNGDVIALNAQDGSISWKANVSSEVLAIPHLAQRQLVVRGSDGKIMALDARSGGTQWIYERNVPALAVRSKGSPFIAEDIVVDGYAPGKVTALQVKDGKVAWEATVALPHGRSEIDRLLDVAADPAMRGNTLYVTGYQAGVAAMSLRDGSIEWKREEISSVTGIATNRRTLFVTDTSGDLWLLDSRSGAGMGKQTQLHQRRLTAPSVYKDYLVVGDFEGYVHFLAQDDGRLLARIKVGGEAIEARPVVHDDVVYVYSRDGVLAALTAE